jgi:translocator assembly and maintenance protein 41
MEGFENVSTILPKCEMIIGYGSGVIRQASYDEREKRLVDLLVITDDKCAYLSALLNLGYIKRLSSTFGSIINADIVFFPDVNLPLTGPVKIGVIEKTTLLDRLYDWSHSFYIPGRLQKPTSVLFSNKDTMLEFTRAQSRNLPAALAAAVLCSGKSDTIDECQLFRSLISLSYLGDVRVGIAENPRKVDNILSGQLPMFREMYRPFMGSVGLESAREGIFQVTKTPSQLWSMLPANFQRSAIQSPDYRQALIGTLNNINRRESVFQALVGLGTTGLSKSIQYLGRKVSKRIR